MTSVLDRDALEQSPLADLHLIANELGVDGFRRLRKAELIDAIIASQSDGADAPTAPTRRRADAPAAEEPKPRRSRRAAKPDPEVESEEEAEEGATDEDAPRARRPRRGRRGGRGRGRRDEEREEPRGEAEDRVAEGVVELLGNGSAFIRLNPPETTDDDVYVSAAQVKRCELVSGDRIAGPVRAPRRSERFPSLVRVDTINGKPADEVAEGTKFEDLPAAWPAERLALDSEDVTLKAVEWLTPFGKGSRVVIAGTPRSGKSSSRAGSPRRCRAARASRCSSCSPGSARRRSPTGRRPRRPPRRRSPPRRTRRRRPSSRRSSRAAAWPPAGATPSWSSTRSSTSRRTPPARRSPPRATSPTAAP